MQQIIQSKTFKIAAAVFAGLFLLVLAFAGGVKVGLHKAKFSGNFDKHYEENFAGKGRGGDARGGKDSRGNKGCSWTRVSGFPWWLWHDGSRVESSGCDQYGESAIRAFAHAFSGID